MKPLYAVKTLHISIISNALSAMYPETIASFSHWYSCTSNVPSAIALFFIGIPVPMCHQALHSSSLVFLYQCVIWHCILLHWYSCTNVPSGIAFFFIGIPVSLPAIVLAVFAAYLTSCITIEYFNMRFSV